MDQLGNRNEKTAGIPIEFMIMVGIVFLTKSSDLILLQKTTELILTIAVT